MLSIIKYFSVIMLCHGVHLYQHFKLLIDFASFHVNIWFQFKFVAKKYCPPSIPVEVFHNWSHIQLQKVIAKHWIEHSWTESAIDCRSDIFVKQLNWHFEKRSQLKNVQRSVTTIQIFGASVLQVLDIREQRDVTFCLVNFGLCHFCANHLNLWCEILRQNKILFIPFFLFHLNLLFILHFLFIFFEICRELPFLFFDFYSCYRYDLSIDFIEDYSLSTAVRYFSCVNAKSFFLWDLSSLWLVSIFVFLWRLFKMFSFLRVPAACCSSEAPAAHWLS